MKGDTDALKAWGRSVGRAGMSQAVLDELAGDHSYKNIMRIAGAIKAIAIAAKSDEYWNEQVEHGYRDFIRRTKHD